MQKIKRNTELDQEKKTLERELTPFAKIPDFNERLLT